MRKTVASTVVILLAVIMLLWATGVLNTDSWWQSNQSPEVGVENGWSQVDITRTEQVDD